MSRIHEEFASQWEKVYNRLRANPPSYEQFKHKYGKYTGGPQAGDLLPTGAQLHNAALALKSKELLQEWTDDNQLKLRCYRS